MIKLSVKNKEIKGIKNSFVLEADEPVTMSLVETDNGHMVAYFYQGTGDEVDEYTEPVGCFDSALDNKSWTVE